MKQFIFLICLLALPALTFGQMAPAGCGTTTVASGLWSSPSTWSGGVPTSSCTATITAGYTVTVDTNNAVCSYLYLGYTSPSGYGVLRFNASSQLTVNNTFTWGTTIAADSGTIDMTSGGTLILNGTVTVNAAQAHLYAGTGTIEYFGVSQTVAALTYNNLTISQNNGDAHLGGNTTVNGALHLGGSNILLGTYNLTIGGSVTGAAAGTCLVTNGSGYVSAGVSNLTTFTFPIGPSGTTYNPVTLTNHTGTGFLYTARVETGENPATGNDNEACSRTWSLTGFAGGTGVDLDFYWNTAEAGASLQGHTALATAWNYYGSAWIDQVGSTTTGTPNRTSITNTNLLDSWTVGTGGALPIQLASLTANTVTNTINLEWTTISEVNNYGFYIERRPKDVKTFTTISELIPGAGTSLEEHHYSWIDAKTEQGTHYYRLRQVDLNGDVSYSHEIIVNSVLGVRDEVAPREFALKQNYPNPFNPTTEIKFSVERQEHATVTVYSILGEEVAQLFNGIAEPGHYYRLVFDGSRLGSGLYFYRIVTSSHVSVKKMLMIK